MKKLLAVLALLASATAASAQTSCPAFSFGKVLTPGQWQACFDAKQNVLNYTPVNRAGDAMQGPLATFASSLASAGFTMAPGLAPSSPVNGDMWVTATGLFARVGGVTIGPLSGATAASYAATSPILVSFPAGVVTYAFDFTVANKFTALQTISLNAGTLPAILTGTALRVAQADGVISRMEIDSYGAASPGVVSVVYGRGTGAAPTAVQSGDELSSLNSWGYTGAATLSGTAVAAFRTYAAETFSAGHQGSRACLATTAIAGTTLTDSLCQQNSGGVTIGAPTGGDPGAGKLNAAGLLINNVAVTAAGITALTGDVTATGPGSAAATIAANAVTYAKLQQVAASSLVGNPTGSLANAQGVTLGATLAFSGTALQTSAHTGDVTTPANSFVTTLATAQPAVHTWALAQTFTVAPVFTDQSGSRTALGLGTAATQNTGTSGATLPLINGSNSFSGNNSYSGTTTWSGSLIVPVRTVTAAGAITVNATTDYFICVNKSVGAATTANLPGSPTTGLTFLIKDCKGDSLSNNITITPAAGNIDGSGTYVLAVNFGSVAVTYNGSSWSVN